MLKSKYFKRSEFDCLCGCGFDTVDAELLDVLEDAREFNGPIYISSGCRCAEHNESEGGSEDSQHLIGRAADCHTNNVLPQELYKYLNEKYPNKYGIGLYNDFVHIDTRHRKARW
jgi:uncharacterized protein YcbK (DUF882 family)